MEKVLVKMDRIEKIAKFIDMCDDCPLYGKCHRYSDGRGCKEAIIDYLLGNDPTVTKEVKLEPINCKSCWYYQEHKGKVDCTPCADDGMCLRNLCDK